MPIEICNQTASQPTASKRKRGFTLTEIAIVLGIIGLILGAIWGAASAVYSNKKVADSEQAITASAAAVRSLFASANGQTGAGAASTSIVVPGMFPITWSIGGGNTYANPWNPTATAGNGTAYIFGSNTAGDTTQFDIELDGLPSNACSALASYFSSSAAAASGGQIAGLIGVTVSNAAPTLGTAKVGFTGAGWANGLPGGTTPNNCLAAGTGVTGNNIAIVFDMAKM